jgi:hypothetical protein
MKLCGSLAEPSFAHSYPLEAAQQVPLALRDGGDGLFGVDGQDGQDSFPNVTIKGKGTVRAQVTGSDHEIPGARVDWHAMGGLGEGSAAIAQCARRAEHWRELACVLLQPCPHDARACEHVCALAA